MDALRESFSREVAEALRRSRHLALINRLHGADDDQDAALALTGAFDAASREFMTGSSPSAAALPAWNQLFRQERRGVLRLFKALTPTLRSR
jgi:hypothetical protein